MHCLSNQFARFYGHRFESQLQSAAAINRTDKRSPALKSGLTLAASTHAIAQCRNTSLIPLRIFSTSPISLARLSSCSTSSLIAAVCWATTLRKFRPRSLCRWTSFRQPLQRIRDATHRRYDDDNSVHARSRRNDLRGAPDAAASPISAAKFHYRFFSVMWLRASTLTRPRVVVNPTLIGTTPSRVGLPTDLPARQLASTILADTQPSPNLAPIARTDKHAHRLAVPDKLLDHPHFVVHESHLESEGKNEERTAQRVVRHSRSVATRRCPLFRGHRRSL